MNRYEKATAYHHQGFNCCQSVLAAYTDPHRPHRAGQFRPGRRLWRRRPDGRAVRRHHRGHYDPGDDHPRKPGGPRGQQAPHRRPGQGVPGPLPGEVRGAALPPLLKADIHADDNTPVARDMGLTNRCDVMIITAMEIVEEIRAQQA